MIKSPLHEFKIHLQQRISVKPNTKNAQQQPTPSATVKNYLL